MFQFVETRSNRFPEGIWGAFNISILIEDFLGDEPCIHFQFHLEEELPFGLGRSVFVSVSHKTDSKRCKANERVLAISTHAADPEKWDRKDEDYYSKKDQIVRIVVNHLQKNWNGFHAKNIKQMQSASPASWLIWIGRKYGRVGGIPASYFRNLLSYPNSFTPAEGFYLLGDTVYTGQGIPGVVLGALNLFKRLG